MTDEERIEIQWKIEKILNDDSLPYFIKVKDLVALVEHEIEISYEPS